MQIINWLRKRIWWVGVALAVVAIGLFVLRPKKTAAEEVVSPVFESVREEVKGTGSVNATGVTEIFSPSKGIVKRIYVKDGDLVKANDRLFEVTSTANEQEKATAWAALALARSNLKTAEMTKVSLASDLEDARRAILDTAGDVDTLKENILHNKANPNTGKGYTEVERLAIESALTSARTDFGAVEKKYLAADDAINSARAALSQASVAYSATRDSVTKAPISGNVYNLRKIMGDQVGIVTDKDPVLVLADTKQMKISFQVSEFNVAKVAIGQEVEISFDAIPGVIVPGSVEAVDTIGSNQSLGTVTYNVTILMKPSTEQLLRIRPAMTANITILTQKKDKALVVPRSAVRSEEGRYFVVSEKNGERKKTEIKVGIMGADKVEVVEGLGEGDLILKMFEI